MYRPQEKDEEYLKNKLFVGIVENNVDPKRIGRIKVRVQGVFNDIDLEHIPWSAPFQKSNGTDFKIPANGKIVNVIFPQGNLYFPEYIYSENYNINLQNKLKDLKDDEYKNFIALLFDHRTQVYSDDTALNLDYFDNAIRIKKSSIDVKLKDNTQLLKLGHSQCSQDAVLGTNFFKWFDSFMTLLLQPETLTGNLLAPVLRPALDLKIQEYQALRSTFVSNNVKIVDNGDIAKDEYDSSRLENPAKDDFCKINDNKLLVPSPEPTIKKLQENITDDRKSNITEKVNNEPIITNTITDSGVTLLAQPNIHDQEMNIFPPDKQFIHVEENDKKIKEIIQSDPYDIFTSTNIDKPGITSNNDTYGVYKIYSTDTTQLDDPYADFFSNTDYIIENIYSGLTGTTDSDSYSDSGLEFNFDNLTDLLPVNITTDEKTFLKWCYLTAKYADTAVPNYAKKSISKQKITALNLSHEGFKPGVHGLCGVGTLCHMHTLLGTPMLFGGNAEDYSFAPKIGKGVDLREKTKQSVYLYETKKAAPKDYFTDSSKWQIGDICAYGYADGRQYGHIQIYLGKQWGWCSDFVQKWSKITKICHNYSTATKPLKPAVWRLTKDGLKIALSNIKKVQDSI
jgi:hypothetical protein